jgi:GDP-4-dehydro-6-deoxy-D-mannose reductase
MTSNILITGATGFVGRHLIAALRPSARRKPVEIFGTCFPEHPEHCADLCSDAPELKLIHLDLRSEDGVNGLLKDIRPARIFHLAAISHVRTSWEKRRETLETNLMGSFFLFEGVRRLAPKARLLVISSSDVYGFLKPGRRSRAYREEERDGVVSPYAFTKVAGELLAEFYALREKLAVVIARPFPHTGPGQTADFVCADWARQIALIEKNAAPPFLRVGNLEPRRDYSDVRDVVRAYALLMGKGRAGQVYNVASGRATSLKSILRRLLSFSPRPIEVRVDPAKLRKDDIPFLAGSNKKIREATGWAPRIPLDRTLRDLLDFWRGKV